MYRSLLWALLGCGYDAEPEGAYAGECVDGADNDRDGDYDCGDKDCADDPFCVGTSAGTPAGATSGTPGGTAGGVTSGTVSGATTPAPCDLSGTWSLTQVLCGGVVIDSEFFAVYGDVELQVTEDCSARLSLTADACAETEVWTVGPAVAATIEIARDGIESCDPEGCTFFAKDDPCVVGDHVVAQQGYAVQQPAPDELRITGVLGENYSQCTLDLTTQWELK